MPNAEVLVDIQRPKFCGQHPKTRPSGDRRRARTGTGALYKSIAIRVAGHCGCDADGEGGVRVREGPDRARHNADFYMKPPVQQNTVRLGCLLRARVRKC